MQEEGSVFYPSRIFYSIKHSAEHTRSHTVGQLIDLKKDHRSFCLMTSKLASITCTDTIKEFLDTGSLKGTNLSRKQNEIGSAYMNVRGVVCVCVHLCACTRTCTHVSGRGGERSLKQTSIHLYNAVAKTASCQPQQSLPSYKYTPIFTWAHVYWHKDPTSQLLLQLGFSHMIKL